MAVVQPYTPEVSLEGPVRSEESINVNPEAFGTGVARAAEGAASTAEQGAYEIIQKDNYIRVEQARQQFMSDVDAKAQSLMMNNKGLNAANTPQQLNDFIAQRRQDVTKQFLTNGRQLNQFDIDTLRYARFAQNGMDAYARRQADETAKATSYAAIDQATQQGAAATTPELRDHWFGELQKSLDANNQYEGRDKPTADLFNSERISKFRMASVYALNGAGDPASALDYFTTYKSQINQADRGNDQMEKILNASVQQKQVTTYADKLLPSNPPDYDKGLAVLDKGGEVPDNLTKLVRSEIKQRQADAQKDVADLYDMGDKSLVKDIADTGRNLSSYSGGELQKLGVSPERQLEIAKLRETAANREAKVKDPSALDTQMLDVTHKIAAYDSAKDLDHSQFDSLLSSVMDLKQNSPERGAYALTQLNQTTNPDKGISKDVHDFLYVGKESYSTKIGKALESANTSHWYSAAPLSAMELSSLRDSLVQRGAQIAKANPTFSPAQVEDALHKDPHVSDALQKGSMAEAFEFFKRSGGGKASKEFNESDFAQPEVK